jgi:hypothetical protein
MVSDRGIAPNPFHGYCTLALCTPNHMKANLKKGDCIVGCFRSGLPPRVVYIMQIDEIMTFNDYYHDRRFVCKKPSKKSWITEIGDNIYYMDETGKLRQDKKTQYHNDVEVKKKDMRGNKVFISKNFVYFGEKAKTLPDEFTNLLPKTQGIKYLCCDKPVCDRFIRWAKSKGAGIQGKPRDKIHANRICFSRGKSR